MPITNTLGAQAPLAQGIATIPVAIVKLFPNAG